MHAIYIQQRGIVDSRSLRYIFFCSSLSTLQFLQSTFASLLYKKGDYLNLAAGWMDRQYPRRQNMCICVDCGCILLHAIFYYATKNMIMMYNFAGDIIGTE